MRPKIDLADFDHNGNLKTPPLLLLSIAYLSRYLLIFLASGLSTFVATRRGIGLDLPGLPPVAGLFSSTPAALIFSLILTRERLLGGSLARYVSQYGRPVLVLSAVVQAIFLFYMLMKVGQRDSFFMTIDLVLLGYATLYIWRSRSSRVYFGEFCTRF